MNKHELYYELDCAIYHLEALQEQKQIIKFNNTISDLKNLKLKLREQDPLDVTDDPCSRCALKHLLKILSNDNSLEELKQITNAMLDQMRSGGSINDRKENSNEM